MLIYYDIVSIEKKYRGMDRSLETDTFVSKKRRFNDLLNLYFESIDITCNHEPSRQGIARLLEIEEILHQAGVPCEVIAYCSEEITNAYGYPVKWLGIDIVHKMCESLIEDVNSDIICSMLNSNGLCDDISNINRIIQLSDHGGSQWDPCYVYQVAQ